MKSIVFLGGGRITSALVAGLRLAKYDQPLLVHDRNRDKLRELQRQCKVSTEPDLATAVEQARLLIIAVRPDSVRELLNDLHSVKLPPVCVSLAAGVPLSFLKQLASSTKWARAMPSPVCRSAKGLTALAFERSFPGQARIAVTTLFGKTGEILEVPEREFDAFTVTYSSSHGYHALATLAEAAHELGLSRKTAMIAAAHALAGGIQYWQDSKANLDQLLHEAATPGGIAGTVMASMDAAGYAKMVKRGLWSGIKRARRNSRI